MFSAAVRRVGPLGRWGRIHRRRAHRGLPGVDCGKAGKQLGLLYV
jgi:hypothetical protein